jgi:hypothetical protein
MLRSQGDLAPPARRGRSPYSIEEWHDPAMTGFDERIRAYGNWRADLTDAIGRYGHWLADSDLSDPQLQARFGRMLDRLRDDRMTIAFVAEFSRGKSELINAIFFAGHGQRMLPSSAGRTTMCPTEIRYDRSLPIGIRLLPIETRLRGATLAEWRHEPGEWRSVPIHPGDPESLKLAFECVRETKRVPRADAERMGLYDGLAEGEPVQPDSDGRVEVSCWRHALVNIPHPLLELGLVIIDTPGLNAIGAEPELTLSLIPSAHAVLFLLAADTGVTRTDIEVWRKHISPSHRSGRFVILNKIDGLWDELRRPSEIDREIAGQVESVAHTLQLSTDSIYPVSAQKGLVAKLRGDRALLARSRLPQLEHALSHDMVPRQQSIVGEQVRREFDDAHAITDGVLGARRRNLAEQLFELNGLRGKNRVVIEQMARRIRVERAEFEASLRKLQALRTVFSRHSQALYRAVGIDGLKRHVRDARQLMRASQFSSGLRDGMASLLDSARTDLGEVTRLVEEVQTMMAAMYQMFNREHGLTLGSPMQFSAGRYLTELRRIEALHKRQFGAISLMTTEKWALTRRFFESVAARLRDLYEQANRELESWLRAVMAPIESQVREHQLQLRRRLDSVQRIVEASEGLESRINEIEETKLQVEQQLAILVELSGQVHAVIARRPVVVDQPVAA